MYPERDNFIYLPCIEVSVMAQNLLLQCTECGRLSSREGNEIKLCEARPEKGAVHKYEVISE